MDYVPFTADEIALLKANSFDLNNDSNATDSLLLITKLKQGYEVRGWYDEYGVDEEGYWGEPNLYPTIKSAIEIL